MTRARALVRSHRLVLVVVGLLLAAIGTLLFAGRLPAVRVRVHGWAEDALARHLGREVRAERVDVRLLPAQLALHRVRVANRGPLTGGALLEAEEIRLGWSWRALFRRTLAVRHLQVIRPRLSLRPSTPAETPWTSWLHVLLEDGRPAPDAWIVDIPRVDIREGAVAWETNGFRGRLEDVQGFLERQRQEGTARLAGDLRAARLLLPWDAGVRELSEVRIQGDATAKAIQIADARAVLAGARLSAKGGIVDPSGAAQLDLELTLSSPVAPLLERVGLSRDVDAHLGAAGRLRGSWDRPVFQGRGEIRLAKTTRKADAIVFDLRWAAGRLEFEALQGGRPDVPWWSLILEPATGAYRAYVKVPGTELDRLSGLPVLAARLAGFERPAEVGGRLVADVDVTGRGADVTTLRGRAALRVDDLSVDPGLPPGRLEAEIVANATQLTVQTFSLDVPGGTVRGKGRVTFADGQVDLPFDSEIRSVAALGRGFGLPLLGGTATLAGRLAGTRDAPMFHGQLTWREPRIGLYGADRIEGEIEWLARTLRSPRLAVRIGQTVATLQGSAVAMGSAPLRSLDLRRDITLDLQGRVSPGRTADVAQFLPAGLEVHGTFTAAGRLTGAPRSLEGEIEVAGTNLRTWDERWQRGEAVLRFAPGTLEVSRLSLRRGAERLRGDLRVEQGGTLRGRFSSTPMDLAGMSFLAGSRLAGRAAVQGEVQGTVQEPRTTGSATTDAVDFRGVSLGRGVATFAVGGKAVDLDLTFGNGSQRVHLRFDPPPERDLRVRMDLSDADLAPLLALAEIELFQAVPARGTGRILLRGPAHDFANAAGEAHLSALHLLWDGEAWENRGPIDLSWRERTVDLRQVRLASRNRTLDLQGTLAADGEADLQIKGRLPLLALAGRIPMAQPVAGTAAAELRVRGMLRAPDIQGTLDIADGTLMVPGLPAPFEAVQGIVDLERQRVLLRSVQGTLAGGTVRVSGDVTRSGDTWILQLALQTEGNRAERILAGRGRGHEVTGALSVTGSLTSRGRGDAGFWPNLDGNLKLLMQDGHLGRQTLMVRVLSLMNLAALLDLKAADVLGPGIPYRRLTSDIAIEHGVARTENLLLESLAFNLSGVGRVDLANETVEMDVAVKPFPTVDRLITAIPLAGRLLGGKDRALIAAFYRVTGPLGDPKVTSLPLKGIGRNTFGIFQRLLELPEAVIGP